MSWTNLAAGVLTAGALAVCVGPARAGDDYFLRLGGGTAETVALGTDIQADTVAVAGRGGFAGGRGGFAGGRGSIAVGRGGFAVGRGGFAVGRGGFVAGRSGFVAGRGGFVASRGGFVTGGRSVFVTGARGGFVTTGRGGFVIAGRNGFVRSPFNSRVVVVRSFGFSRPFWFSSFPSFGFGWSAPYFSYVYPPPLYWNFYGSSPSFFSPYDYPLDASVIDPSTTSLETIPTLPMPRASGYAPMPPAQGGTFPYDGGPANPVPMPRPETVPPPPPGQPAPMGVPPATPKGEDRKISLPGKASKYSYPAYGDGQKQPTFTFGRDLQVNYPPQGR
jgi:hypothetical protein